MWEKICTTFEQAGMQVSHVALGAFATLWVVARQGKGSIWRGIASVCAGSISTAIISPFAIAYLNITQKSTEYAAVFLIGILGMNAINTLIEHTPALMKKIIDGIGDAIGNLFNKKSNG